MLESCITNSPQPIQAKKELLISYDQMKFSTGNAIETASAMDRGYCELDYYDEPSILKNL